MDVMRQSPLLSFKSSAFPTIPGEDAQTNPGIYGKALAEWLGGQLRARGLSAGAVIAEDFGWCIPIEGLSQPVYVVCASGDAADAWQVFSFVEPGLFARLFGRDDGQTALQNVFGVLHESLTAAAEIRELREET
jgi:hypothetical protein